MSGSGNRRPSAQIGGEIDRKLEPQAVAQNSFLVFGMQVVTKILGLTSSILLANYLNTRLFGKYNYAFAFAALFIPLCDLGMDTFIIRQVARGRTSSIGAEINSVLTGKTIFTLLAFAAAGAVAFSLESSSSGYIGLMLLVSVVTFSRTYWNTFSSVFRAIDMFFYDVTIYSLTRTGEFIVVVATILLQKDLYFLLINLAIVNLTSILITFVLMSRRFIGLKLNSSLKNVRQSLRGGLPFALSVIFTAIYFNLDTVLLKHFVGETAAGLYRASYNLILPLLMVTTSFTGAIFPFVSQNFISDPESIKKIIERSATYLLMIALPGAVIGTFLAEDVIVWLYSAGYAESSASLMILVWFLPVVYITNLFGSVLGAIDDQRFVLIVAVTNVIFNVTANMIMIPAMAQNGAAIVIVLTELLGLSLLTSRMLKKVGHVLDFTRILRIIAACAIVAVYLFLRPDVPIFLTLALALALCIVSLILTRAISIAEIKELMLIMRRSKLTRKTWNQ